MKRCGLSRSCAACRRQIGGSAPETMVMIVYRKRVRWLHEACAWRLWNRLLAREEDNSDCRLCRSVPARAIVH